MTPEEATSLFEACSQSRNADLPDLVEFVLFTGLRRGEALGLTWERVDRARGVVLLNVTKNHKRREVPLNSRADAVLARRGPKNSGLVFGSRAWDHFRTAWERAVERAKLVDFHFHDLRHTFASWAVQRGATLQELKDPSGTTRSRWRCGTGISPLSISVALSPVLTPSFLPTTQRKTQRKRWRARWSVSRSSCSCWCARQGSNLRPSDSKSDALSD